MWEEESACSRWISSEVKMERGEERSCLLKSTPGRSGSRSRKGVRVPIPADRAVEGPVTRRVREREGPRPGGEALGRLLRPEEGRHSQFRCLRPVPEEPALAIGVPEKGRWRFPAEGPGVSE